MPGGLPKAEEALERTGGYLKDADRLANLHHLLGTAYLRLGDGPRATSHFERIVRSYPGTPWAKSASRLLAQPTVAPAPAQTAPNAGGPD